MKLRVKDFAEIPSHWNQIMSKYIGKLINVEESYEPNYDYIYRDEVNDYHWYFKKSDFNPNKIEKRVERMRSI